MNNRGNKIGIVGAAIGVVLLCSGCTGAVADKPHEPRMTAGVATIRQCARDRDCTLGFCDRRICVDVSGKSNYGGHCDSVPPAWSGQPGELDAECGGYLCAEGRCRSCRRNAECQHYFGAGECVFATGAEGRLCRLPAIRAWDRNAEWNGSRACSNVGPDIPVSQRLDAGHMCVRDCDCQSGFCDRGTCAAGRDIGAWNYGKGWCDVQRPIAPSDRGDETEVISIPPSVAGYQVSRTIQCVGYLCIDHRCRSCVSDLECQDGREEYRCLPLYGLPGKRCGWPGEATLGPASKYPGAIPKPPDWVPEHEE